LPNRKPIPNFPHTTRATFAFSFSTWQSALPSLSLSTPQEIRKAKRKEKTDERGKEKKGRKKRK